MYAVTAHLQIVRFLNICFLYSDPPEPQSEEVKVNDQQSPADHTPTRTPPSTPTKLDDGKIHQAVQCTLVKHNGLSSLGD